jgi:hypothetical protein
MNRTKDNNYEQGYYTGFCQYDVNSELKPGKSESSQEFGTSPSRSHRVDWTASDRRRIGLCPGTTSPGSSSTPSSSGSVS